MKCVQYNKPSRGVKKHLCWSKKICLKMLSFKKKIFFYVNLHFLQTSHIVSILTYLVLTLFIYDTFSNQNICGGQIKLLR